MSFEQIRERMESHMQNLETLPENTIACRDKKKQFLSGVITEYNGYEQTLLLEMKKRYQNLNDIKENEAIASLRLEEQKLTLFKKWNQYNTPYEKMHLDYYLYQLQNYYREDLKGVNSCLYFLLQSFKNVGIELTANDFNFHPLAAEYIQTIMDNSGNEDLIQGVFENIYWKCSEIIEIIEMNFKSLYYRNFKKIEKYYSDYKKQILEQHNEKEIYDAYYDTISKRIILESIDVYSILQKFVNREVTLNDISVENILRKKERLFKVAVNDMIGILGKLNVSITEYESYLKYQYIIDDMRDRIKEKEKYKGVFEAKLKEIEKLEKELIRHIEKKEKTLNSNSLFGKFRKEKRDEHLTFVIRETSAKIEGLYKELDNIKYNDLIFNKMSTDTHISDALKMASSNYIYFVTLTKRHDESKSIKDITDDFQSFVAFANSFAFSITFTILNNVYLLDDKNLAEVIVDRYKLSNVSLELSDLEPTALNETKKLVSDIIFADNLSRTLLNREDIEFYLEMKKANLFE